MIAGALSLFALACPGARADEKLDINLLIASGNATVSHSAIDIGQIASVFDGNTGSLARSASVNPLVVTLSFDHPQTITRLRTWFLAGDNGWRADAADSMADLDSGTGTFTTLVDWTIGGESAWSEGLAADLVPRSIVRFQLYRLKGDDYVHLNELEIHAGPVPLGITDIQLDGSDLTMEWSSEPGRWYRVQQSDNLADWTDAEFRKSDDYSTQWSATLPAPPPPGRFWRVRTALPEERAAVIKRVLVLSFDPVLENRGNQRLSTYAGWNDVEMLTAIFLGDLEETGDYYADWQVVQLLTIDEFPPKLVPEGWRYTDDTYLDALEGGGSWHSPDGMDYDWLLTTPVNSFATDVAPLPEFGSRNLNQLVADGLIDEVIVWGGPYFGYYESRMVGATAYWCNSPGIVTPGVPLYVVMGLNYERGPGEALHSFCHRAESIMAHVFGSWSTTAVSKHLWDRFTRVNALHDVDFSGVGTVHYPPNGQSDYDYDNSTGVTSDAADWLDNYPAFLGSTSGVDNDSWNLDAPVFDPQRNYLKWWLGHMPHKPGRYVDAGNPTNDGKLNNWWGYLSDMNAYPESR